MLAALFLVSLVTSGLAAPTAPGHTPHFLAKRSLLWPGRIFGGDRWGVVIGPATNDQAALDEPADKTASSADPAANPAASPFGPIVPVDTTTQLLSSDLTSTTLKSLSTKAPNGFQALKPSTTRSTTALQPSVTSSVSLDTPTSRSSSSSSRSTPKPSSTKTSTSATRSTSTSKPSPKPTSTPKPSSTSKPPSSPKPTSTPRPTSKPSPTPSPTPKPTPKPTSTKVITTTTQQPRPTTVTPEPAPPSTTTSTKTTQQPSPAPTSGGGGNSTTPSGDIAEYLKGHNDERAKHGAVPLTWNQSLADKAQQWANNCQFKHSGGTLGPFGENLAAGTGSFSITDGIRAWNDEAPDYDPSNPQASHWTQVVWKSSTQVGCAVQRCTGIFGSAVANYFVCEYSPQGNFIGRFAENVQK